ncbi:GNAT family N-acetyltransferase [Flavivirga jejuensis]|uniref:GNAT family N-acetyltransferase n=1 Tax=Flavivirga jejuensis TaxID=870487 RepID=A0ABT8WTB0_9FLAO|nr:GNAT family N-acetyltransferase [Flavivirga jejuensis]MDO5976398.1 GNAT family N-acetyltransferase [Flavivirga jejuensis]
MNKATFGKAKLSEALQISILMKTVNVQAYAIDGIRPEMATYIDKRFSPEYIESVIKSNTKRIIVSYLNNNPIGVAEIILDTTCPIKKIKTPELSKLYILERFYGKGVGYKLLKEVEKELYLEVFTENPKAVSFYERQSYQKIGKVDFPMQDNNYRNWVMTKKLN